MQAPHIDEEIFHISPEYSGTVGREQWYISANDGMFLISPFQKAAPKELSPDSGNVTIRFDQNHYTWTDRVGISISAPEYNNNPESVQYIGGNYVDSGQVSIYTGAASIDRYVLKETGKDTGIFAGHVTLTGFLHDADGDKRTGDESGFDTDPRTGGTGPANGLLATSVIPDTVTVAFGSSLNHTIMTESAPIRWNAGTIHWLDDFGIIVNNRDFNGLTVANTRVIDPDMNLNPELPDSFEIVRWSNTDRGGHDIKVTETGNSTGIFEGRGWFTQTVESDHRLMYYPNDVIHAKYTDNTIPDDMCEIKHVLTSLTISDNMPVGDFTILR